MPINLKDNEIASGDTTNIGVFKTRIPTDGLVFFLDAADLNSYSGTGTAWNDLSGNGNNFTWTSAPTVAGSGLGTYLQMDNNKKATGPASNSVGITDTTGYSIIWISLTVSQTSNSAFKFYTTTGDRGIFAHPSWTNSTIYFDQGGCCADSQRTSYTFTATDFSNWRMWTLTSDVYTRQIWMNDVVYTTNTTTAANLGLGSTAIDVGGSSESFWDGRLKVFFAYRRRLERYEINQIYQALKGRL